MFEQARQTSAISREISRLLPHPAWKQFDRYLNHRRIEEFLRRRNDELRNNPFMRPGGTFDASLETRAFLLKVLQQLVDFHRGFDTFAKYRHAAEELAQALGVPVPEPTPGDLSPAGRNLDLQAFPRRDEPVPRTVPATVTASSSPVAANATVNPTGFFGSRLKGNPAPSPAPPSDEARMSALRELMTHPATPEHERRAATEAYIRLLNKRAA